MLDGHERVEVALGNRPIPPLHDFAATRPWTRLARRFVRHHLVAYDATQEGSTNLELDILKIDLVALAALVLLADAAPGEVLLVLHSAFGTHHSEAIVAGSDQLLARRIGEKISGELFDRELIKGLVRVERRDDIIAEGRDADLLVAVITDRVGVADQIQPPDCQPLTKVRRGEQAIDQPLPGLRRVVREKSGSFFRGWRQAASGGERPEAS